MSHPPSVDWNDLKNSPEPDYNWLVPDLWEYQDRFLLTGNEGKGKSTFLRQIGLRIAAGIHPFQLESIEPRRVLLVDCENSRRQISRKMKAMPDVKTAPGYLTICHWPEGLDLLQQDEQLELLKELDSCHPELVILGPIYKLTPRQLDPEAVLELMHLLDMWRNHFNFTLLLESHQPHEIGTNRNDRFRPERPYGPSEWMRWPDFGRCLEDDGRLRPWRGDRDERDIPEKFVRGGLWPWEVDQSGCRHCGRPLTGKQQRYCSEKCSNAARQNDYRHKSNPTQHGDFPINLDLLRPVTE